MEVVTANGKEWSSRSYEPKMKGVVAYNLSFQSSRLFEYGSLAETTTLALIF